MCSWDVVCQENSFPAAGFELETNWIKVLNPVPEEIIIIAESEDKKLQVTSDTFDTKIEGSHVNLEIRTVGGLVFNDLALNLRCAEIILQSLHFCCYTDLHRSFTIDDRVIAWRINGIQFNIFERPQISTTSKQLWREDCVLRPQLTFSLPDSKAYKLFGFLGKTEQTRPRFMGARVEDEPLVLFYTYLAMYCKASHRVQATNLFVNSGAIEYLDTIKDNGFCWLFTSYVFDLFVLNGEQNLQETGLKPFLKVMSRLSFSDMYETLDDKEKAEFNHLCRLLEGFYSTKVKPYKRDNPKDCYDDLNYPNLFSEVLILDKSAGTLIADRERITLIEWINSIKNPHIRGDQAQSTDLLSPPPHTEKAYSMGTTNINVIPERHLPALLVKCRGYSECTIDNQPITIVNFREFINNEFDRFFAEVINGEMT